MSDLRITFDARELARQPAGKGLYFERVVSQWVGRPGLALHAYVKPGQADLVRQRLGSKIQVSEVGGRGFLWHWNVARQLKRDGAEVFFAAFSYFSGIVNPVPTLTVVHDLAVFKVAGLAHNRKSYVIERLTLRLTSLRSAKVVAISESTKRDVCEQTGIDPRHVAVTPLAPLGTHGGKPLPWEKRSGGVLFVGTLEPRKNISTILKAYAALSDTLRDKNRLILAGKPGWGGDDYRGQAAALGIADQVEFLGYVDVETLEKLYRQSNVLVWPSWYEGFGLPVIEAMAEGTPVVTSNTSSLPELVGPEGILCEPQDHETISKALSRLLTDNDYWRAQSTYLYERSQHFSWKVTAGQTLELLKEIADTAVLAA